MDKKQRTPIPSDTSSIILFKSDRTCCICRDKGKEVQIHHIDENPENNDESNLAVLCLECHNQTQIRGGFGRKLDSGQIKLYRDSWYETVERARASTDPAVGKKSVSVNEKKDDDASILVEVTFGSTGYETGSPVGLYLVTIKNFSDKPVILSSVYVELPNKSRIFNPLHYNRNMFPHKLEPEDSFFVWWEIPDLLGQVEKSGFKGLKEATALYIDRLGREYRSKPFSLV
jgi:hypothetical protein